MLKRIIFFSILGLMFSLWSCQNQDKELIEEVKEELWEVNSHTIPYLKERGPARDTRIFYKTRLVEGKRQYKDCMYGDVYPDYPSDSYPTEEEIKNGTVINVEYVDCDDLDLPDN